MSKNCSTRPQLYSILIHYIKYLLNICQHEISLSFCFSFSQKEKPKKIDTDESLRAEAMEGKVVNFFHPDYIRLLNLLKYLLLFLLHSYLPFMSAHLFVLLFTYFFLANSRWLYK